MSDAMQTAIAPEEWAHIEVFGRRSYFGRISEVERFGAKMMRVDVPTADPAVFETYFYGGAAIFSCTICTEATARAYCARAREYAVKPRSLLPPGEDDGEDDDDPKDADEDPV